MRAVKKAPTEPAAIDKGEALAVSIIPAAPLVLVPLDPPARTLQTVNLVMAMSGLSEHSQRAYRRWIGRFLCEVTGIQKVDYDARAVPIDAVLEALGAANLKAWLGRLKMKNLGKQSIGQAKASIVWLAQLMGDMERATYELAAGLSRVKSPRAEFGQRAGSWLTVEEIRQILRGARASAKTPQAASRNAAMITLLAICGLRRDEITRICWGDLQKQGKNRILSVHGKGAKLRQVKLSPVVVNAIEAWRVYHPTADEDNTAMFTRILKSGLVMPTHITDKTVWLVVQDAATAAGLSKISPHDLRRSFARGAYEAGTSFELIRQSLGHSNIATTEHYVNSTLELDHSATDIWSDALSED